MASVAQKRDGDDQEKPGPAKQQRTDDDDSDAEGSSTAESTAKAGPGTSAGDGLFDDDQLKNIILPDSNPPIPDPLPTGQSNIDPASGNPIEPALASGAEIGAEDGSGDGQEDGAENAGKQPVAPRRTGRQAVLDRIREATAKLNGLTDNYRPCDCPPTCPGPINRGQDQNSNPTPPNRFVDTTRLMSRLLVTAEGSKVIDLPRFGPEGTQGRLRMSLEVHDDPYGYRSRLGYYGELYMTPTTDNQERAVGYVSSWRVSKPNARNPGYDPQIWTNEWLRGELPDGDTPEIKHTNEVKTMLRRLYDVNGQPRPNSQYLTANSLELGDNGNEMLYISMIWIYDDFPAQDNMAAMWLREYPQQEGESDEEHRERLQRTLEAVYRRHGYVDYDTTPGNNVIMGRVIMPRVRDLNDRLLPTPGAPRAPVPSPP
ncbi:hypothetical protein VMCG_07544 [Cytospora schulzeri]|uniref:Uncharacterized protein n=1 Tax=Cytospora schulzeri TaxID=448051 RepID=A0A423VXC0_9PEZI|nr:hypothetical protein VMCG_07544 [Valsa malicola]